MKNYLKNLIFFTSVVAELIGLLIVLMQYKILPQDIVVLVSFIFAGILIIFGVLTFVRTLLHSSEKKDEQPADIYKIKPSVVIFWASLICSLIMMIITNVLAFIGINFISVGTLCCVGIWCICVLIPGIMYLFDFVVIDDKEWQRKARIKNTRTNFRN